MSISPKRCLPRPPRTRRRAPLPGQRGGGGRSRTRCSRGVARSPPSPIESHAVLEAGIPAAPSGSRRPSIPKTGHASLLPPLPVHVVEVGKPDTEFVLHVVSRRANRAGQHARHRARLPGQSGPHGRSRTTSSRRVARSPPFTPYQSRDPQNGRSWPPEVHVLRVRKPDTLFSSHLPVHVIEVGQLGA